MIAFSEFRIATFHFVDLVCRGANKVISAEDVRGTSATGLVSRAPPLRTAMRNCTSDEGGPFESGNPVLISNHRKQCAVRWLARSRKRRSRCQERNRIQLVSATSPLAPPNLYHHCVDVIFKESQADCSWAAFVPAM